MHEQGTREGDDPDDRVMTGDGAAERDGPKPTMTGRGAVVGEESPEDRVMTGDGAEPRDGAKPRMTADGALVPADDDDPDADPDEA
jgi:hypothetical protein